MFHSTRRHCGLLRICWCLNRIKITMILKQIKVKKIHILLTQLIFISNWTLEFYVSSTNDHIFSKLKLRREGRGCHYILVEKGVKNISVSFTVFKIIIEIGFLSPTLFSKGFGLKLIRNAPDGFIW
jgi:hypothetical protein